MSIADYKCNKCGKITEFNKISSKDSFPEKIDCEYCKSNDTRRIWNTPISIPQSFKAV